jgi:uncharacterized protein YlzI (FlbEa/FlbD family)
VELLTLFVCLGLMCRPIDMAQNDVQPYTATEPVSDAVMLTRPDGTPIWVNPHAIAFIRGPTEGEAAGHTTLVFTSGAKQTVMETVDEIKALVGSRLKHHE